MVHMSEGTSVTQSSELNVTLLVQTPPDIRSDQHTSESESEQSTSQDLRTPLRNPQRLVQPLGIKEICLRVGKFSGRKDDEDFGLWLADFEWQLMISLGVVRHVPRGSHGL